MLNLLIKFPFLREVGCKTWELIFWRDGNELLHDQMKEWRVQIRD
jgi:hypothetical protein